MPVYARVLQRYTMFGYINKLRTTVVDPWEGSEGTMLYSIKRPIVFPVVVQRLILNPEDLSGIDIENNAIGRQIVFEVLCRSIGNDSVSRASEEVTYSEAGPISTLLFWDVRSVWHFESSRTAPIYYGIARAITSSTTSELALIVE
jgi:hypothetical protein